MLVELRRTMDAYLLVDPMYKAALMPYDAGVEAPAILKEMSRVSHKTGIGPMSAVAGAVAKYVADFIKSRFAVKEVIVENGGDIYAEAGSDMDISVFAGKSPLSERVGLHIPATAFQHTKHTGNPGSAGCQRRSTCSLRAIRITHF